MVRAIKHADALRYDLEEALFEAVNKAELNMKNKFKRRSSKK